MLSVPVVTLVVAVAVLALLVALFRRRPEAVALALQPPLEKSMADQLQRTERLVRDDLAASSRGVREEVGGQITRIQDHLLQSTDRLFERQTLDAQRVQETLGAQLRLVTDQLQAMVAGSSQQAAQLVGVVEQRLTVMAQGTETRLDQMRVVVEEKLQATLTERLGASFKQVSDRLELVTRGIGEMQQLAVGVGDLRKLLSNVKARGVWGEVQLEGLLSQMLTPAQYEKNVCVVPGSGERVEFALRIPGASSDDSHTMMPIDCKFPVTAWQALVTASEAADAAAVEKAEKAMDAELRRCALEISRKYIAPPRTTDIAILYLPIEALFADVARRSGLLEELSEKYRVMVAGPTTLGSLLTMVQLGFRTVAIQEQSKEIMKALGGVKSDLGKFGDGLAKLQDHLRKATNQAEDLDKRRNILTKRLRRAEDAGGNDDLGEPDLFALPEGDAQ